MLWVYEGMTEYCGIVLAARSGLWSPEFTRDALAQYAASFMTGRAGRQWRNLQDTTSQPILSYRGAQSFPSWQRSKDYYTEGALLWLDVDTRLRELTRGRRSLDDFARAFFRRAERCDRAPHVHLRRCGCGTAVGGRRRLDRFLRTRLDNHGPGCRPTGCPGPGGVSSMAANRRDSPGRPMPPARSTVSCFRWALAANKEGKVTEVYWAARRSRPDWLRA